jgi:hypothetical protein
VLGRHHDFFIFLKNVCRAHNLLHGEATTCHMLASISVVHALSFFAVAEKTHGKQVLSCTAKPTLPCRTLSCGVCRAPQPNRRQTLCRV